MHARRDKAPAATRLRAPIVVPFMTMDADEMDNDCICGGRNHGAGIEQAIDNTRELAQTGLRERAGHHPRRACRYRDARAVVRVRGARWGQAGQAPGVVKVRLAGVLADIGRFAALLAHNGVVVLGTSGSRANRCDPGERVYLTVRVTPGGLS